MTRFYQHKKPFSRTAWIFIFMIIAGTLCFGILSILGTGVNESGELQEAFYLLPAAYLLTGIGIIGLGAKLAISLFRDNG